VGLTARRLFIPSSVFIGSIRDEAAWGLGEGVGEVPGAWDKGGIGTTADSPVGTVCAVEF
jgi:hypothetical protein